MRSLRAPSTFVALTVLLTISALPVPADEGMWTFDAFPSAKVQQAYGFGPDQAWLDHVRLSSVRLARGCSASFVSPDGLVMTNHHCAHSCVEQLSSAERDYVANGFIAAKTADEIRCPEMEVNQLTGIRDVTDTVEDATRGVEAEAYEAALRAVKSRLEDECTGGADDVRCDVVTLYHGGKYQVYKYRRFQDVRLVFAPEFDIAFFGGDPDNFNFPRYDLDVSFVRVYVNGRPAQTPDYLHWSPAGSTEGELTFVSGHPGGTSRLLTVAQLEEERDHGIPDRLIRLAELRGMLGEFQHRGAEAKRISEAMLFGVENSFKSLRGRLDTLLDPAFMDRKRKEESELRARVAADPERQPRAGGAWDAIAQAVGQEQEIRKSFLLIERGEGFSTKLFRYARTLLRLAAESRVPNEKRLREYAESNLPALRQELLSTAPVHAELEEATLELSLTKLREQLGADDPFVRKVLGPKSPTELASALVGGTKLADPAVRRKLLDGGEQAVAASNDPMIVLARQVDSDARALREKWDVLESTIERNGDLIARARFAVYGTSVYPDATFSLRLSYGKVAGWRENGRVITPYTTIGGAFERATGRDPFELPKSWIRARDRLDPKLPLNFVTDNDIIGGNSGSPVVDKDARVVGLVFDGNIYSLGGDYWFDERLNRTVAVDSRAILEALDRVYHDERIVREIKEAAKRP